jgi:hypothetical protein
MILTMLLLLVVLLPNMVVAQNNESLTPTMKEPVVRTGWLLVNSYWRILELRYTFNELRGNNIGNVLAEQYVKEMKKFEELSEKVSGRIIKALTRNDQRELKLLSNLYISMKIYQKPAFELAVKDILVFMKTADLNKGVTEDVDYRAQYFPGYGYADPKFIYRKGLEVGDDLISDYWQEEEKTLETHNHFEGAVEIEVAAGLREKVGNFKQIGEPFKVNIGGSIKVCVKVSFDTKETLITRSKKQYAVHKLWFELFRAKRDVWVTPKWEICGKTYELRDEPTGFTATVGVNFVK